MTLAGALFASALVAGAADPKSISPSFDGWAKNADETYTLFVGYINRNDTEINILVGADNQVTPSTLGGDAGQPTAFQPGRQRRSFRVTVPSSFKDRIVWTLGYAGKTEKATASLNPIYIIEVHADLRGVTAPSSKAGPDQTVAFGTPVKLNGTVEQNRLQSGIGRKSKQADGDLDEIPRIRYGKLRPRRCPGHDGNVQCAGVAAKTSRTSCLA
jgi:hypothetical protein